ncbi:MAG TPA: hypothetical protein VJ476_11405 [Rhizomicrobium sp.]|nr:hypothetical protein [Rhizomicrobium sp.]
MNYYIRFAGEAPQIWKIDETTAVRLGVSNPEQGPGCYFRAAESETIWDTIRRSTPWFEPTGENPFHKIIRGPGEYYPRIWRPSDQHPYDVPSWGPTTRAERDLIAMSRGQLTALTGQLEQICRTVHPCSATLDTFGHEIRNLLILASTEVEGHWRGILTANGFTKDRYSTHDYVLLQRAMRLSEYAVSFDSYPWLQSFSPFQGWGSTGRPTSELEWYDAYNAVKHNREAEFRRARLEHVFEALSAIVIMATAQFGFAPAIGSELRGFFRLSKYPKFPLADIYIYPYDAQNGEWIPVPYTF